MADAISQQQAVKNSVCSKDLLLRVKKLKFEVVDLVKLSARCFNH